MALTQNSAPWTSRHRHVVGFCLDKATYSEEWQTDQLWRGQSWNKTSVMAAYTPHRQCSGAESPLDASLCAQLASAPES